ncbi:polysaccharide deacetylase family protein [Geodermatophilus sp. DSM 44513]|uniref:polysaccharide deacetylase family protein n=1 Tax=Geodermatophilus sp. DSM 44513 TaxID=1528104 RepID=UPI001277341B|nr:polysaccharide deacetylase family protein [Geodermatophilus sp. DSM 44513]WNV76400.1 polysaccharide deacetylase family protein [Geodermatophilus sp. DSM 44513]
MTAVETDRPRVLLPPVLMYHSISPSTVPDPHRLRVHPRRLAQHLQLLRRLGLRGVSLGELVRAHDRGQDAGLVGLTFDDGYTDFLEHAVPVLQRHGMTGTVYVVAGRLGGQNEWDTGPRFDILDADQVRAVAATGQEVGSHTVTHARLAGADASVLATEVRDSRQVLEEVLQEEVRGFCYPYGSFDRAAADAVRAAGYDHACVTGDYDPGDRFTLPRCYVAPRDGWAHVVARLTRHHVRVRRRARG